MGLNFIARVSIFKEADGELCLAVAAARQRPPRVEGILMAAFDSGQGAHIKRRGR